MLPMRTVLLLALASIAAVPFLVAARDASRQEEPAPAPEMSGSSLKRLVQGCRKCHEDVHAEWSASHHATSWTNPALQAAIEGREDGGDACARCHAPLPILESGTGKLPNARRNSRQLGVNCVTCHVRGNNEYHGPHDSSGHGGIVGEDIYRQATFCISCHGQPAARREHDQGTSFLLSPSAQGGVSCQACHMPGIRRALATRVREEFSSGIQDCRVHSFSAAREGSVVAGCADLGLELVDQVVRASVSPNTGHTLPASSGRKVVLAVEFVGADGSSLDTREKAWTFPDGEALMPGVTTEVSFPAAPGTVAARAVLRQIILPIPGRPEAVVQTIAEATTGP